MWLFLCSRSGPAPQTYSPWSSGTRLESTKYHETFGTTGKEASHSLSCWIWTQGALWGWSRCSHCATLERPGWEWSHPEEEEPRDSQREHQALRILLEPLDQAACKASLVPGLFRLWKSSRSIFAYASLGWVFCHLELNSSQLIRGELSRSEAGSMLQAHRPWAPGTDRNSGRWTGAVLSHSSSILKKQVSEHSYWIQSHSSSIWNMKIAANEISCFLDPVFALLQA